MQQRVKKDRKPFEQLVQELSAKVVQAASKLQLHVPSAERPGARTAAPAVPEELQAHFDLDWAFSRLAQVFSLTEDRSLKSDSVAAKAFGMWQDCRKYRDHNWIVGEDGEKFNKIVRQLEVLATPSCTSQVCRELYKLTEVGKILGPFVQRDPHGHQGEMDHEFVRKTALGSIYPDLVSLLKGRDALLEDAYPYLAELASVGVKVQRKTRKERILEIFTDLPKTEDLPLLPDYGEHELGYRAAAQCRDEAAGILISGPNIGAEFLEALGTLSLEDPDPTLLIEAKLTMDTGGVRRSTFVGVRAGDSCKDVAKATVAKMSFIQEHSLKESFIDPLTQWLESVEADAHGKVYVEGDLMDIRNQFSAGKEEGKAADPDAMQA